MTHALIAAKSGWGKGWLGQWWIEDNYQQFDHLVVLDRRDEYRGLVKSGAARWAMVGPDETVLEADDWRRVIEANGRVILCKHRLGNERWQEVAARVTRACMALDGDPLVVIDEAHKVAPQRGSYPNALEDLATEGRGRVASVWITQRLAKLDETPIGEMMIYLFGGFQSDSDLKKVGGNVGYPADVHRVNGGPVGGLPDELEAPDEGPIPVRKFTGDQGKTIGSEWIYSDDDGQLKRINSRDLEMDAEHHGPDGLDLSVPG